MDEQLMHQEQEAEPTGSTAAALDYTVLGTISCRRDGTALSLGGPQQRRVLAALIADAGKVVSVDRLVDAIWSDDPPEAARRTTMTYVSRLRAAVGDGVVHSIDPGYRIDPIPDSVDALHFVRLVDAARRMPPSQAVSVLEEALALWHGPAYGEFATEWWALPHASRLEELKLVATEERIEALLAIGDHGRAISDLDGLVAAYPLRERLVAQLMRAYAAAGRQTEALRTFRSHCEFLAEETGLTPSEALVELEATIVAGSTPRDTVVERTTRGYVLGEMLGEGAFGSVYRSVQPGIDREVAVKVIRSDLADDPTFVRRFEAEAQLVAHLEHPHIVPLYDFWREPGGAFLVFRLLRGGTAEESLARDGTWPLARVSRFVDEIGGALVAAHRVGIVHRDVKPSNILFDDAGNAYLSDFGIATDGTNPVETSPASAGSPLYAPPEQFQHQEPDPFTDQYSFAAVIYELLTGAAPFDGDSASTILLAKLQRSVPSISARRTGLPLGIDAVLQQATATNPTDRFPDVGALMEAWHIAVRHGTDTADLTPSAPRRGSSDVGGTVLALATDAVNPYVGLRAFAEADTRRFHGREDLGDELLGAVTSSPLVAVVGPSGSGKSSLVHAGLVPLLRANGDRVATMVPGEDPLNQLRLALLAVAVREPRGDQVAEMVRSVASEGPGSLTLVIDQFEELWTLTSELDRRAMLAGLAMLATGQAVVPIRLVVTIRADFYDRPLADPDLGPMVGAHTFPVTPMTAAELHEAITAPSAAVGVVFEPGLDSEIVAEVIDQPAGLPLLQFTLAELFERRSGAVITRRSYLEMHGIAGSIASRAEAVYAGLDEADAERARRLLLRLVVPGEGTEDTRRRVRRSDLPPGSGAIADVFEQHRLLVADRDVTTREPTVEVAHESLLRSWPRLRTWLLEDRDVLRSLQHLGESARSWEDAGRPESELYRGARLESVSEVAATRPDHLTESEAAFVAASASHAQAIVDRDRRQRRRLQRLLTGTAVALVLALAAGGVAYSQRQTANEQRNTADARAEEAAVSQLVSESQSLAASKRDVAALLALEASRRDPGPATDGALMTALYTDPSFLGDIPLEMANAGGLSVTPDGDSLWATPGFEEMGASAIDATSRKAQLVEIPGQTEKGWITLEPLDDHRAVVLYDMWDDPSVQRRISVVDVDTGRETATATFSAEPGHASVSPDGTKVAVTILGSDTARGSAVVYSLPDLARLGSIDQPGPPMYEYAESNWVDDDRLAVGSSSGTILIWQPTTGRVLQRLNDPAPAGRSVGLVLHATQDGATLVSAGNDGLMAWDLATGQPIWATPRLANGVFVIDERHQTVYAQEYGGGSSRLLGFDLRTGEPTGRTLDGQHGTVCDIAMMDDGRVLALASCNQGTIALWALDSATSTSKALLDPPWETGSDLWSPDGTVLGIYSEEAGPKGLDLETGEILPASGHRDGAFYFQADGDVVNVSSEAQEIVIASPRGGAERRFAAAVPEEIGAIAWSDDVGLLAIGDNLEDKVVIIDLASGKPTKEITTGDGRVLGMALSRDGTRLYVAGQGEITHAFDLPSGDVRGELPRTANVVLSPDGKLLAGNAFDGTITFYDPETLERSGEQLPGAGAFINVMQFTPDGKTLITSGLDNTLRMWDVESRRQIGPGMAVTVSGAAISPDSHTLAITTTAGVQRLAIDRETLRASACRTAARNLTDDEWRRYIGGTPVRLCPP